MYKRFSWVGFAVLLAVLFLVPFLCDQSVEQVEAAFDGQSTSTLTATLRVTLTMPSRVFVNEEFKPSAVFTVDSPYVWCIGDIWYFDPPACIQFHYGDIVRCGISRHHLNDTEVRGIYYREPGTKTIWYSPTLSFGTSGLVLKYTGNRVDFYPYRRVYLPITIRVG